MPAICSRTKPPVRDDQPSLQQCLDYVKAGDVLVVWRLDRLGRPFPSARHRGCLHKKGIAFRTSTGGINAV
ncbi:MULTISPECIES: recombinase family protein [Azotobacter]|uniref:recombinase family protein n=1 Tax=Azotobacter TaxID=352 RepID=UPI0000527455